MGRFWRTIILICATPAWTAPAWSAASVTTHPFGRYEVVLQEGTPVAMGEFLGLVRRQTGLPEYPLMLGAGKQLLELNLLGPGNRPYRLTSTPLPRHAVARAGPARFTVERSVREGETLAIHLRQASRPVSVRLVVDLHKLARLLEGER
jgi:hypothetical protein